MASERAAHVREAFPELESIPDSSLRAGVLDAWATAMVENGIEDLTAVPWFPPAQRRLGIADETLVDHVRDVTTIATDAAARLVERRAVDVDVDVVLAGALVHDVSKLYEFDGHDDTAVQRLLGHPHYGVHVAAAADLPVAVQHVVLAHSSRTAVEPETMEAEIVRGADAIAAAAIKMDEATDDET